MLCIFTLDGIYLLTIERLHQIGSHNFLILCIRYYQDNGLSENFLTLYIRRKFLENPLPMEIVKHLNPSAAEADR